MKQVYPAIFHKTEDKIPYFVEIPDLNVMTQGKNLENAIEMAREIICIAVIEHQKKGEKVPPASDIGDVKSDDEHAVISLVDADIDAYRRMLNNRSIRKNVTIPSWLNEAAEAQHINFSAVLQAALIEKLHIEQ